MPVFSLIIPVYNVEPYLAECLDSCINQTFKDLEIICIDDCSTDNSSQILREYAKQDKRIKIITHNSNKGLGAARNTGIEAAGGDYCWFIDSDDYIILNACEILNGIIAEVKADIFRFNRIDYSYDIFAGEKTILPQEPYSWKPNRVFTKKDHTKLRMPEVSACMYITSVLLLKTVKFREGVIYEDSDFTPILFSKSGTICNVNYSLYCVRRRLGSITRNITGFSEKRFIDTLLAIISLYNFILLSNLPKKHFCTRTMAGLFLYIQDEYGKHTELHTLKLDNEMKKVKRLVTPFIYYLKINDGISSLVKKTYIFRILNKIRHVFTR